MLVLLVVLFMQQLASTLTLPLLLTTLLSLWPTFPRFIGLSSSIYFATYKKPPNMAFNMVDINPFHLVASLVDVMSIRQVTCKHENLPLDMYLFLAHELSRGSFKSNNQWFYLPLRPNILPPLPLLMNQLGYINFLKILTIHNLSLWLYLVTIGLVLLYLKIQSSMNIPNILKFVIIFCINKLRLNYCL
jgi:hypothetical protein